MSFLNLRLEQWIYTLLLLTFLQSTLAALPLDKIQLPEGYSISLYAQHVPDARQMALGPNGTVFVGTRRIGKVYALVPNADGSKAEKQYVIAENLNIPNGVAMRNGDLYVAENQRITRFDNIEKQLANPPKPTIINDELPKKGHHGWRYMKFGPDGLLYVAIGSPCNICKPEKKIFGTITRMDADGKNVEIYAEGIRNSVGFAWQPQTKELWFTDNGRDWLGDDIPSDELNRAPKAGLNFGFPYVHAGDVPDPKFGKNVDVSQFNKPVLKLGAHVAALGMTFVNKNQLFIAEHGSWNRSQKVGYNVSLVTVDGDKVTSYKPFATGWLQGKEAWGRPVDVLAMPDGALLVSDDRTGVIYRIATD